MATLKVTSTLDPSGFNKGVEGMKRKAKEINGAGGGLFGGGGGGGGGFTKTAGAVAVGNMIKDALMAIKDIAMAGGTELRKLGTDAQNLGASIESTNEIQDSLATFGVAGDQVISMLERINASRDAAIEGNDKLEQSFVDLGVSMEDLKTMDPTELFGKITKAMAEGKPEATTAAGEIIGKRQMLGNQLPLIRFGEGQRTSHMNEATQEDADILTIAKRKAEKARVAVMNTEAKVEAKLARAGVTKEELAAFQAERAKTIELQKKNRAEAAEDARKRREDEKKAKITAVETEYQGRIDELKNGMSGIRPEVDQFMRQGMVAGPAGGAVEYNAQRNALQIATETKRIMEDMNKAIQKIEGNTKKTASESSGGEFG